MASASDLWRAWRRRFKASLPYVRRREYRNLERRHAELIDALDGRATPAASAALRVLKAWQPSSGAGGEVCFFVSHAPRAALKQHVRHHLLHLLDAGIRVLLVVNADPPAQRMTIEPALLDRLGGAWVRHNIGFDFGAWAHAWSACDDGDKRAWSRLYLVNDSIVGPLDGTAFARLLERVRSDRADVVGLTEALSPRRHLQSYFLVLQRAALRSQALPGLFARLVNWPDKQQVIDVYETRLTALLEADGLRCTALFPSLGGEPLASDDTSLRWAELVAAGFPYLKTRVIARHPDDERIRAWLRGCGLEQGSPPR